MVNQGYAEINSIFVLVLNTRYPIVKTLKFFFHFVGKKTDLSLVALKMDINSNVTFWNDTVSDLEQFFEKDTSFWAKKRWKCCFVKICGFWYGDRREQQIYGGLTHLSSWRHLTPFDIMVFHLKTPLKWFLERALCPCDAIRIICTYLYFHGGYQTNWPPFVNLGNVGKWLDCSDGDRQNELDL